MDIIRSGAGIHVVNPKPQTVCGQGSVNVAFGTRLLNNRPAMSTWPNRDLQKRGTVWGLRGQVEKLFSLKKTESCRKERQ